MHSSHAMPSAGLCLPGRHLLYNSLSQAAIACAMTVTRLLRAHYKLLLTKGYWQINVKNFTVLAKHVCAHACE